MIRKKTVYYKIHTVVCEKVEMKLGRHIGNMRDDQWALASITRTPTELHSSVSGTHAISLVW